MADVRYTPTFRHTNWVDNVDRVGADGPNGLNVRFRAIESDLNQVSTVVAQIGGELDRIAAVIAPLPSLQQTRIEFTPAPQALQGSPQWTVDNTGALTAGAGTFDLPVVGVVNLALPNGVRLTQLRFRGSIVNGVGGAVSAVARLGRMPLRPTIPAATMEMLLTLNTGGPNGTFDSAASVAPDLAVVDLSAFRYVLTLSQQGDNRGGQVTVRSVEITYALA